MYPVVMYLFIVMSSSSMARDKEPVIDKIAMSETYTVREQAIACNNLKVDLLKLWKTDPVISRLNVSLTCVSTVQLDLDN